LARHSLTDDVECAAAFGTLIPRSSRSALLSREFRRAFGMENADCFRPHANPHLRPFSLTKLLDLDRKTYLAEDLMFKADRMSMTNSLEVRCPFLDHRLIALSMRLPESDLLNLWEGKILLRRLASRLLPKSIVARRKRGFSVPVDRWLTGPLAELFADTVRDRNGPAGIFDYPEVARRFAALRRGDTSLANQLWAVFAFHQWWRLSPKPTLHHA
jgi:asparagine synthase (glutamine-hydrolysing)